MSGIVQDWLLLTITLIDQSLFFCTGNSLNPVILTLLISGIVQDWLWLLLTITLIDQSLFFVRAIV